MTSALGGAADLGHLSEFAGVLVADVSTRRGGFDLLQEISDDPTPSVVADLLLQRSQRSDSLLLVSKDGDNIVGLGVAAQGPRVTHIGLFVRPSHRNQGRGTTMLDQLIVWANDHGSGPLEGWSLPGDRSMKQRFEITGFKARLLIMQRPADHSH